MRTRALVALLLGAIGSAACVDAGMGQSDARFDILRVDVGHPTASVAILDRAGSPAPRVAAVGGGVVTILRHVGNGDFEIQEVVPAGHHPVDLAAGDLDGDGALDLVVANHETTYLTLLFGTGAGFGEGRSYRLPVDVSPHPHAVAVVDVNEDRRLDIIVDDRDRDRLVVYRGGGDGSFEVSGEIPVGGDPYRGMSVGDVNADGHLDVVTPNPRSVAVRLGDGAGGFDATPDLASASVPPFSAVVTDIDGDGSMDVLAGSGEGAGYVMAWLGAGDGSFQEAPGAPYAVAEGPTQLYATDVDADGVDDVLATSYVGGEIAILSGGRSGTRVVRIALGDNPWGLAAGDVTGDGAVDVVVANDGADRITILRGRVESTR